MSNLDMAGATATGNDRSAPEQGGCRTIRRQLVVRTFTDFLMHDYSKPAPSPTRRTTCRPLEML
jgi:hypothetical protein